MYILNGEVGGGVSVDLLGSVITSINVNLSQGTTDHAYMGYKREV